MADANSELGWKTWEIALPGDAPGQWRYPFSVTLMGSGDPINVAIADMLLLEELGFPPRPAGRLKYSRSDKKKPKIFRFRCKPSCWRLYFFADDEERRII